MQVHDEEDSSDEEETTISVQMGREALELVKKNLEQRQFTTESDIRYIQYCAKVMRIFLCTIKFYL